MEDQVRGAGDIGFEAHGQNQGRETNPFLPKAEEWDAGWTRRERERLVHELRKDEAEQLEPFLSWAARLTWAPRLEA